MNRIRAASTAALLTAALTQPASAAAASNSATTSIPVDPATQIEMHVSANCVHAVNRCDFNTTADLLTQRLAMHEQTAWMLRSLLE